MSLSFNASTDEPVTEELRVSDWLGLAGFLAEAVDQHAVTVDLARAELASSAAEHADARALRRAATIAATSYGTDTLVTRLLYSAVDDPDAR